MDRALWWMVVVVSAAIVTACGPTSAGDAGVMSGGSAAGGGAAGGGAAGGGAAGGGAAGGGAAGGGAAGGGVAGGGAAGGGATGGGATGGGAAGGGATGGGVAGGGATGGGATGGGSTGGGSTGGGSAGGSTAGGSAAGGSSAGGSATGGGTGGGTLSLDGGRPVLDGGRPVLDGGFAAGAISFTVNAAGADDYGVLTQLPPGFGQAEFTLELWIRPDPTFPTGACTDGTMGQRTQWCTADPAPGSSADWWYKGNFLLDGHNNGDFSAGTFSLQLYGAGRVRWQLGDQGAAGAGGTWGVQASPATAAPSLLDGRWHHLACVRRWQATTQARLELWVDGVLTGTQVSNVRTNLATRWSTWSGFPSGQAGWFFGAEKQSAIGVLSQYEDYKGLVSELRFWTRALASSELTPPAFTRALTGTETGLAGWIRFDEGTGTSACDTLGPSRCLSFSRVQQPFWR